MFQIYILYYVHTQSTAKTFTDFESLLDKFIKINYILRCVFNNLQSL